MKKWPALFFGGLMLVSFFLAAGPALSATYYISVADGNDTNCTGLNQDAYTSGTDQPCPWKTIAKINASTFQAGDSILFKRGEVWRGEKITVPSSGTAGNPITFSAYGSGDNPLVNGSTLLDNASFSPYSLARSTLYSVTPTTNTADGSNRNYRQVVTVSATSTTIQISLQAADSAAWVIGGASIGPQSSGSAASSFTRITWNNGQSGVTIGAGTTATSDIVNFSAVPGQNYLVHVYMTARNLKGNPNGTVGWYDWSGSDETLTLSPTMTSGLGTAFVKSISGDGQTIYSISQATDPLMVLEDSVFLKKQTATSSVANAGSWFWDGVSLFVNAGDQSSVLSNGKKYEIGNQQYGFWDNGKSYLDLSYINFEKTHGFNGASDIISGVYLTGSYNKVHDLTSSNTRRHNFCFYVTGNHNEVYNLTLHDDITTTPVCIYGTGTNNNILRDSEIYSSQANTTIDSLLIFHGGANNNIVEHNNFHIDNGSPHSIINTYSDTADSHDNIIRYNKFSGDAQGAVSASGNYNSGYNPTSNDQIYGNLIDARSMPGGDVVFLAWGSIPGWEISHNTIVSNSTSGAILRKLTSTSTPAALVVKNNIFYGRYLERIPADSQANLASDNNIFYHTSSLKWTWGASDYTSLANWRTNSSQDANSTSTDPLFTTFGSNYSLQPFSPAIDAGTTTAITETEDYAKNPIYGPRDIGAYEYQPPYTTANSVSTEVQTRIYGDGKWRPLTATSTNNVAKLAVTVSGTDTTKYLDLTVGTWQTTGTYSKYWTETSSTIGASTTAHTVGDLNPGAYYVVSTKHGDEATTTLSRLAANGSGQIAFNYTGGYSTVAFGIEPDTDAPTPGVLSASGITTTSFTVSLAGAEDTNSGLSTTPYVFHNLTTGTYSAATANTSLTYSNLNPSTPYQVEVAVTNLAGNTATTSALTVTTPALGGLSGSISMIRRTVVPSIPTNLSALSVAQLEARIAEVKAELALLQNPTAPATLGATTFSRFLRLGDTGPDVKALQVYLNTHGFPVATSGLGSSGQETTKFGAGTYQALKRFQQAHGLPTTAYFGPLTKKLVAGE